MTSKNIQFVLATIIAVGFSGCAATKLHEGASKVIVSKSAAPKSCKFLGTVIGEQGGAFSGPWTSNKNLAQGAMNDMKNKAAELGGNYVVLENTNAGSTMSGSMWSMSAQQTDVTHAGNAYKCKPADIGLAE